MEEIGLDLSKEYPKPLTDGVVRASDVVIKIIEDINTRQATLQVDERRRGDEGRPQTAGR